MIKVLLADDQALVRAGFRALLDAQGDIEVAAEASDGEQAVSLARQVVPDVILMDIRMPGTDGLAATRQIAADERLSGVRVVILTTFELDEYVFEAIRSGAAGFLVKDTDPDQLVQAVRVVADGGALLSPGVTRRLIGEFAFRAKPPQPAGVLGELTDREREVLALVGEGLSNAEIAGRLYVSPATAKTHVSRAMVKLGARDRAQLVVIAYESGLVRPGWHVEAPPGRPGTPADPAERLRASYDGPARRPRDPAGQRAGGGCSVPGRSCHNCRSRIVLFTGAGPGRRRMGPSSSREARVQAAWKADRAYLFAIAAGMLGRPAEAEDVVQEAFARLAGACIDEIEDVRGWLVVVTRRLCLDRLGSADTRRTAVTPEPPEAAQQGADPADRLALDDEIRRALAVVVDRLSPAERTSFLLHDIFGFPFGAVAELVGRTPAACRQLARRARLSIRAGSFHAGVPSSGPQGRVAADLAERFVSVCEGGDLRGLIDLLDPDVAGLATVLGLPPLPPARGASAVAERALFFFGPSAGVCLEPFTVEGRAAVVARRASHVLAVVRLDERAGRIFHMHAIARRFGPAPR